jgi:hypothetical protein
MGFYEDMYLIRAVRFVPGSKGITSNNIKKINSDWYYSKFDKELKISNVRCYPEDLSEIIHSIDDNKIDNFEKYNINTITEDCDLKGLILDWYIMVDGFTTLDVSNCTNYTNFIKITNNQSLSINKETIQKYKKINKNNNVLIKMDTIQKNIEQLSLEYEQLKKTLIE